MGPEGKFTGVRIGLALLTLGTAAGVLDQDSLLTPPPRTSQLELSKTPLSKLEKQALNNWLANKENNKNPREHLIGGLSLVSYLLPRSDFQADFGQKRVIFKNRDFEIDNPLHFHLLASILEVEFKKYSQNTGGQEILRDFLWLFDKNPPVSVDNQAFPFLATQELVYLSRILQALERANLPLPQKISYLNYQENIAPTGYFCRLVYETNHPSLGYGAIIPEIGHFISQAASSEPGNLRLAEISQEAYEKQTGEEDYAESFAAYFLEGGEFREELEYWREEDPAVYQKLQAKSKFMRKVFDGLEFTNEGRILVRE